MIVVAGVGLRPRCGAAELVALVRRAEAASGMSPSVLAAPAFRGDQAALAEAADLLGVTLRLVGLEALRAAQPGCPTRSARAQAAVGVASVAEASALAAAGPGARLLLERIASPAATCALAEAAP